MNSFLLFIAGLLVLALSALFAAPYFVDWNDYRDVFEAQASKLIGRSVDVGGDVSLTLLPAPVLRFETINVSDAEGKFETPLAAAKSVTVWLSVPPLLRGKIEARSIEIVQPVVNMRINEDGTGNWADLGGESATLPFIPSDVALNSVEISDATINVWRGKLEPDITLDSVGGELSSKGLQGPYKFNGQFTLTGQKRELRLSTGKPEENGEFRLIVSVRSPESRDSYQIDGAVRGLGKVPVFKGKLSARLADKHAPAKTEETDKKSGTQAPFEIKSELFAGLTGAQFNDFELTINKNNKPQTVKGLMDMTFEKGIVLGGTFSSKWVDLDALLAKEDKKVSGLRAAMEDATGELLARLAGVREGSLRFFLDQAVIAGDLATNVEVELGVQENKLEISKFSARLPGDNLLKLSGDLTRGSEATRFSGPVSLKGTSLARLLRWAGVEGDANAVTQQGEFSLEGQMSLGPERFSLNEAKGDLLGSAFKGSIDYNGGKDSALAVSLQSDRMDLAQVLGPKASARTFLSLWDGKHDQVDVKQGSAISFLGKTRTEAEVNIGAVTLAGLGETAVDMKVSYDGASLDVRRLSLVSGSDAALQAGGRLTGLDGKPEGNITLAIQANTSKGVIGIAKFLEAPDITESSPERIAALTPVLITAAIKSADTKDAGLDVQVEGSLGKSDLLMKVDLAGDPSKWRGAKVALQASLSNSSGVELLRQVRAGMSKASRISFEGGAGRISLEAEGVPSNGLNTKLKLGAAGIDATMQGTYSMGETTNRFMGTSSFNAKSTSAGMALLGLHVGEGHGTEPMEITADSEMDGAVYHFRNAQGTIGGTTFSATIEADFTNDRPLIGAEIKSPEASLPQLFSPVVSWSAQPAPDQEIRGVTQSGAFWPEVPFNTRFMESADAKISLTSDRLRIASTMDLTEASLEANLSDGRLAVSSLEGRVYGGKLKLSGSLQSRGAGAALDLTGEGTGFRLADVSKTRDGTSLLNAPGDLTFSVSGEGLTPLGLVSGLSGKGQLVILDGDINGLSLGAAHAATVAAQKEKPVGAVGEKELGKRVAEQLSSSAMAFSQIKAPFTVNNGIVEFDKIALSDAEGRVIVATYVQLANMQLDSEWALQSAEGIGGSKPRVSLVFSGPLQRVGMLQPSIDTTGLERFVTIRKMQKDVERLEKLDVSGPQPEKAPKPANAPEPAPAPAPVAQIPAQAESPAPPAPPPGPPPPLPKRKKSEKLPDAAVVKTSPSSEPPPVQPVIPGVSGSPDLPPAAESVPAPGSDPKPKPVSPVSEPARNPVSVPKKADTATGTPPPVAATSTVDVPVKKVAPPPRRKPPVPKPVPVSRQKPPATRPAAPPAATPAPAELPWLQSTNPSPSAGQTTADPQSPTQLPIPPAAQDQPQPAPPPRPAGRFNPFGNTAN